MSLISMFERSCNTDNVYDHDWVCLTHLIVSSKQITTLTYLEIEW